MTLDVVAVRGHSTWWIWAIRDKRGVLVQESTTQFRSAAAAESEGRTKLTELEERQQRGASLNMTRPRV